MEAARRQVQEVGKTALLAEIEQEYQAEVAAIEALLPDDVA